MYPSSLGPPAVRTCTVFAYAVRHTFDSARRSCPRRWQTQLAQGGRSGGRCGTGGAGCRRALRASGPAPRRRLQASAAALAGAGEGSPTRRPRAWKPDEQGIAGELQGSRVQGSRPSSSCGRPLLSCLKALSVLLLPILHCSAALTTGMIATDKGGSTLVRPGAAAPTAKYEILCSTKFFYCIRTPWLKYLHLQPKLREHIFQIGSPTSVHTHRKPGTLRRLDFQSSTARFSRRFNCTPPLLGLLSRLASAFSASLMTSWRVAR
jgi:hypothetical protein